MTRHLVFFPEMKMLQRAIFFLLCVTLFEALPACTSGTPPSDANVVIILIDTLRRDRLEIHGNEDGLTPFMDALAREGICFRNAVTPAPWTKPAVASLLTGVYSGRNGVLGDHVVLKNMAFLNPKYLTMAESFKAGGYQTAAFVTNANITSHYRFNQGFDTFVQPAGDASKLSIGSRNIKIRESFFSTCTLSIPTSLICRPKTTKSPLLKAITVRKRYTRISAAQRKSSNGCANIIHGLAVNQGIPLLLIMNPFLTI